MYLCTYVFYIYRAPSKTLTVDVTLCVLVNSKFKVQRRRSNYRSTSNKLVRFA
jgi:hypothetical protein